MHWVPKAIIGFFLFLFLIDGTFIYVATHGLPDFMAQRVMPGAAKGGAHTAFPGVMPHGEDAAKEISEHLAQQAKLNQLGWKIEIEGLQQLVLNQDNKISVQIKDKAGMPLADAHINLAVHRPAQREAQLVVILSQARVGEYRGMLRVADAGDWLVLIHIAHGPDVLEFEQPLTLKP